MNSQPLVSVLVPTKNSEKFLEQCLQFIKVQTYTNIELIVVDNFSTDSTQEIAKKYTDKVFSVGPERCSQRNHGAKEATGEFIVFIDSDMVLSPKVIEACVEKIIDTNIKGVIIPKESFGEGFWAQCKKLERSFYIGIDAIEAARFFHKTNFDAVNGYNEALVFGEDWDLSDRIEMRGPLSRITNFIYHNEGKIGLAKTTQKKFHYAQKARSYLSQTSNIPTAKKRKAGVFSCYFLFFSHLIKLFKNPLLGLGMLLMKTCEFGAGALGILVSKFK